MDRDYTFPCPETQERIYLTDIFRFHEVIDEERGVFTELAIIPALV